MNPLEIVFPAKGRFETQSIDLPTALGPLEVRGPTLCSLISPGTELAWANGDSFPIRPGYAAVFRAEEIGPEVKDVKPGDLLLCMGPHRSYQQVLAQHTALVPQDLTPQEALLARLMGVSFTTLMTTAARPGDRVMVSGAGPVGFLAAQQFAIAGYEVFVVEPDESRREQARRSGIRHVFAQMPVDDPAIAGTLALVIDCSGHEQSVLNGCAVVRPHGEVVLIGVPWRRNTELYAHALLDLVFRKFVRLRSGWEWELPLVAKAFKWEELLEGYNNSPHGIVDGYRTALQWLAEDRVKVDEALSVAVDPRDAHQVYRDLMERKTQALFVSFDWSRLHKR